MHPTLARTRDRSVVLLTLNYLAGQCLYRLGLRQHLSGATHRVGGRTKSIEDSVEYIRRVFHDYLAVAKVTPEALRGRRVLEIGPGDNLGVALMFRAHGAEVACLDRFAPLRDEVKNRAIYGELVRTLNGESRRAGEEWLSSYLTHGSTGHALRVMQELAIENAAAALQKSSFDFIVSRAVLEHVFDPRAAWTSMDTLAAPGASLIHKIDLRSHGFYVSLHPLAFLRIPNSLWTLVSSPDPTLNRFRTSDWQKIVDVAGYDCSIQVTHLSLQEQELPLGSRPWPMSIGTSEERAVLETLRRGMALPFRTSSLEDLAVSGIFLTARKPR